MLNSADAEALSSLQEIQLDSSLLVLAQCRHGAKETILQPID